VPSQVEGLGERDRDRDLPALPAVPSLGGAIRLAVQDFYYHSWRLLPANVMWSAVALVIVALGILTPLAIALVPLLVLPTAGVFRVTTRIARGESVSLWDAVDAWRTDLVATLAVGIAFVAAVAVLGSNVMTGATSDSPLGWALATLAGWGLLATWLYAWTAWPILADPARVGQPAAEKARLAGLLLLARPVRIGVLGVALAVFLLISAVAVVALATVSIAVAALVASRFVLPAADRLEIFLGRQPRGPSEAPAAATLDEPAGTRPEASARP
jgi:hypothetical protein